MTNPMNTSIGRYQQGVTLVELMVAMVLSLVLGAAVLTVFSNNRYAFNQDENVQQMQDDARNALRELANDISMAGHYGDLLVPGSVTVDASLAITNDCGPAAEAEWMYQPVQPGTGRSLSVVSVDNATAAQAAANFSCIAGGEFRAGTDVVSIKRVSGSQVAVPAPGRVYLRTNGTVGLLFRAPMGAAPSLLIPMPFRNYEYRPRIYYIRNFAYQAGDGIPTLCRKILDPAAAGMNTECLAAGIENLQVEYGIDTNGDGFANVYMPDPDIFELQDVVGARVSLLVRSSEVDVRYQNDKTYTLSNAVPYSPQDSFHRRIVSTTVGIQNIRSLNAMGY